MYLCLVSFLLWPLAFGYWLLAVGRLKDGELNSRGFSNPWNTSRFYNYVVWKTGISIPMDFQVPRHVADSRLHRRHFLFIPFVSTDLKVRGYLPSASRLSDALPLCVIFDDWADLICALCLIFSFGLYFAASPMANG